MTTSRVELRLVGGFELTVDDEIIALQPAVQRLTVFVALAPRGVDRLFAAFQLWPDSTEQRAKANLRSALWRLRKLSADVIETTATRLRLAPPVWLDTRDGEPTGAGDDPCIQPFDSMFDDLLPDWYDDWLTVERERYRQLRLDGLEGRARQALACGDTGGALQWSLAALAIDGARESAHRLVVEAHEVAGNLHEARREQRRYRRCVADLSSVSAW